jgi:peptide/nickel transport system substrate-binding protein
MPRRRTLLQAASLLAAPLAAPLATPRLAGAQAPRVLRFIPQSDLGVLDPVWSTAYVTRNHALLVFDTLFGLDAQYRPQPQMLDGVAVERDGLAWRLRLREGLVFHDGAPVLARDCVASIRRWGARDAFGQTLMAATEEISDPDDRTILFRLKAPFPLLPQALGKAGSSICAIMPRRLAETDPFQQVPEMVGSGPFRFLADERVAGARVAYARHVAYRPREGDAAAFTAGPKQVHFDRVEWHVMPDAGTAAAALQAGEMDWWENPAADLLPLLRRARGVRVELLEDYGYIGCMRFNQLQPPFNNPAVRRAVLGAIRQSDFMQAVAGTDPALWQEGVGFFAPGTPLATTAGLETLAPREPAAVRQALREAGYGGEPVVLLNPTDLAPLKALAEVGADALQRAGFAVDVQAMDWGSVLQRLANTGPAAQGGWNVFHTFWAGLDQLNPAVHSYLRGHGRDAGRGWPEAPALEALRTRWLAAATEAEARQLAEAMQRQALLDVPYIPLGQYKVPAAYRDDLSGVLRAFPLFWNLRRG